MEVAIAGEHRLPLVQPVEVEARRELFVAELAGLFGLPERLAGLNGLPLRFRGGDGQEVREVGDPPVLIQVLQGHGVLLALGGGLFRRHVGQAHGGGSAGTIAIDAIVGEFQAVLVAVVVPHVAGLGPLLERPGASLADDDVERAGLLAGRTLGIGEPPVLGLLIGRIVDPPALVVEPAFLLLHLGLVRLHARRPLAEDDHERLPRHAVDHLVVLVGVRRAPGHAACLPSRAGWAAAARRRR